MSNLAEVPKQLQPAPALRMSKEELLSVLQTSIYPGAKIESIKMAMAYCEAAGLDVMQKPVHIVPMWDKDLQANRDVIMPGIGLYRIQAARTGQHAGTSDPEFGPMIKTKLGGIEVEHPEWCRVVVKRRLESGEIVEFSAKEYWLENYASKSRSDATPNAMWMRRKMAQNAKCAEAQALRKGFPEVGAMPTAEEVEGKTFADFTEGTTTIDNETGAIVMPQRKSSSAPVPASTKEPVVIDEAGHESPSKAPGEEETINPGQVNYLKQKIKALAIDEESASKMLMRYGAKEISAAITVSQFESIKKELLELS